MRAVRRMMKEARKARLTSARKARWATARPSARIQRRSRPPSPHCVGEHQARGVSSIRQQRPKLAGLKKCRPRMRRAYLLPMARAPASGGIHQAPARKSSVRPKLVMMGERSPACGSFSKRSQASCVARQEAKRSGACQRGKARAVSPSKRKLQRKPIWSQRGSLGSRMAALNARVPGRIYSGWHGVADAADTRLATDARHAAHVDADRGKDAARAGAVPEPLVARALVRERAGAHHVAHALGGADAGDRV